MNFSILRIVRGIVKLKGDSDNTRIGNIFDALKVAISYGAPTNQPPLFHAEGSQTKDVESIAGFIVLENSKKYGNISCQLINTRDALWRLAWIDNVGGTEVVNTIGYGLTGPGREDNMLNPSVEDFETGASGTQHLRLYMTPIDNINDAYANLRASKLN